MIAGQSPPVISGIAKTTGGDVLENTAYTVTKVGPGTAAVIYADPDFTTLLTSLFTDSNGRYEFYARNGTYQVSISDANADNPPPVTIRGVGADGADIASFLPTTVDQNTQTASYVLVLSDAGKVVELNVDSANTLTVPPNSSVAFPIGTILEVFQLGAGQTTLTPGSGVTIRSDGAKLKLAAQYASASLRKRATNEWVAAGDLSA